MVHPRSRNRSTDDDARHWGRLLWRGLRKRCARCGGGGLYRSWFQMRDRCPTCGMRFEREPGFFLGAYTINLAISIVSLFVVCMALVAAIAIDPDTNYLGFLVVGAVIAVAAPVLCYPFSRTVWSAIDLGMTPLEPVEEAEAALAVAADHPESRWAPDHPARWTEDGPDEESDGSDGREGPPRDDPAGR